LKEGILAKSVVSGAVPVFLFVVSVTALMWVCHSVPREAAASKLALSTAATAEAAEEEFECDRWEGPCPNPDSAWRDDADREPPHSVQRL
jgi:hypothetical protein